VTLPSRCNTRFSKPGRPEAHNRRHRGGSLPGDLVNGRSLTAPAQHTRTFKLAEIIPGWREALQLMPVGSKWRLVVPSELAYGERAWARPSCPTRR